MILGSFLILCVKIYFLSLMVEIIFIALAIAATALLVRLFPNTIFLDLNFRLRKTKSGTMNTGSDRQDFEQKIVDEHLEKMREAQERDD